MDTLSCSLCGKTKPTSEFSPRRGSHRGFQSRCRDCCKTNHCADCGVPIWQGGTYCQHCRFKGERNPLYGTHRPPHVKAAVSKAQRGVPNPPRPVQKPTNAKTGRGQANRLYAKPAVCDRCGESKRLDWHHIDSDRSGLTTPQPPNVDGQLGLFTVDCPDCYGRPVGECPNCGTRGEERA